MKTNFVKIGLIVALALAACADIKDGISDMHSDDDRGINTSSTTSSTLKAEKKFGINIGFSISGTDCAFNNHELDILVNGQHLYPVEKNDLSFHIPLEYVAGDPFQIDLQTTDFVESASSTCTGKTQFHCSFSKDDVDVSSVSGKIQDRDLNFTISCTNN